eukprot:1771420-Pyramimonas_sp.AAC.1
MDAANSKTMPEDQQDRGEQRYRRATFNIPRRDTDKGVRIKLHCGGPIGDPYTVRNFAASFAPCIQRWVEDCKAGIETDSPLHGHSDLFQHLAHLGLAACADDLRRLNPRRLRRECEGAGGHGKDSRREAQREAGGYWNATETKQAT